MTYQGIATDQDLVVFLHGTNGSDSYYRLTENINMLGRPSPTSTLNGGNHTITFSTTQIPPVCHHKQHGNITNIGILGNTLINRSLGIINFYAE